MAGALFTYTGERPMEPQATALINDPMGVFAFLAGVVALVFWVSELPRCRKLFEVVPPVIYVYFLPMLATTAGITPSASPLYDWTVPYLLLFALLMLMVSVDLGSVARLGPVALFMVAAGTLGIVIGGPISLMLFGGHAPGRRVDGLRGAVGELDRRDGQHGGDCRKRGDVTRRDGTGDRGRHGGRVWLDGRADCAGGTSGPVRPPDEGAHRRHRRDEPPAGSHEER